MMSAAPGAQDDQSRAPVLHRTSTVPVWLAPERFEAADFNPDICVADLRRYVPLPTVKAELQAYLVHLKNKLVEAINEDYSDYVGLSSKLTGLVGAVLRMRQPLLEIQAKLSEVQDAIQADLNALQQGLQRRQDTAAARATLELMQEVAASTGKVEKLLQEVEQQAQQYQQSSNQQQQQQHGAQPLAQQQQNGIELPGADINSRSDGGLDNRCRMLERVAGEAARLMYLVDKGQHLTFVMSLERRLSGCRMSLDRHLQSALLAALKAKAWGPTIHCLRAYLEVGEPGRAEAGLRAGLMGPLVKDVVTLVKQQQQQQGGASAVLLLVVQQLQHRLQEAAGPLLQQLAAPGSGLAGIDVLGAVVLAEVSQAVAEHLPGVFSPGNPVAFHANYLAGQQLLEQLEGMAASSAALERLRTGTAAAGWAKRWNLSVYFSLVYQDIAGSFEACVKSSRLQPASAAGLTAALPDGAALRLAVPACLWGCMQRALAPEVFLLQLADRFSKLLVQLLLRFDTWLQDVASICQQTAATAAAEAGAPAGNAARPGEAAAAADGPAAQLVPAAAGPAAWAGSLSVDQCATICADADVIQGLVTESLTQQAKTVLQGLPAGVVDQVIHTLQQLAARAAEDGQQVLLLLGHEASERCMALVRQLKGITATYRMTAKGPPVRHSHYVAGVLQPLRQLLDTPGSMQQLPARLKLVLSLDVIDNVNIHYDSLAEELLITVKKTESSLKRLKKARPGEGADGPNAAAAGPGVGMSDSDKIGLQLYLDVQEHGRQIEHFGLVADQLESYRQLLRTVALADQAQ